MMNENFVRENRDTKQVQVRENKIAQQCRKLRNTTHHESVTLQHLQPQS
jgi:hypothetical protein